MKDNIFIVLNDLPLSPNGPCIKKGEHVHLVNGIFYGETGPFPENIQYCFQNLLKRSDWNKWIRPEK